MIEGSEMKTTEPAERILQCALAFMLLTTRVEGNKIATLPPLFSHPTIPLDSVGAGVTIEGPKVAICLLAVKSRQDLLAAR